MKNKIKVGIYIRVSTQEQANEGYSIQEQKERLEKYADAQDWMVYKVYSDPGFSGGTLERPGLTELVRDVGFGKVSKVLVYKLDRLSRRQRDTLYLIEDIFLPRNVDFVSMTENFDTGTPLGRAMIGILSVFAQLEREQIKERMQLGKDARAKEGYFHGGKYYPIGYDYDNGVLVINEYESMQVHKIYDLCLSGMPIYSIYRYMENHYTHKYGKWSENAVRSVLTSPVYLGVIQWKGETYEGKHEPLVDEDTFKKVNELIAMRQVPNGKVKSNPFKRTSLLGGLLWCGNCGARYFVKVNTVKRHKTTPIDAKPNRYYTCYSRGKTHRRMIKDPTCKNITYNVKDLDRIVLDEIRKLALDNKQLTTLVNDNKLTSPTEQLKALEIRIADIDKQINKLIELYQISDLDFNMINGKIEKLNDEKRCLENQMSEIDFEEPQLSLDETKNILKSVPDIIDNGTDDEIKDIVHSLINSIIIYDDALEIHWRFI